mmetsp:Transcript_117058/g.313837  ORF Transcript_117058/g.313837 Transcript_117058/m.313837 type:complete len:245 (-) Transcript_117058:32-766(-)
MGVSRGSRQLCSCDRRRDCSSMRGRPCSLSACIRACTPRRTCRGAPASPLMEAGRHRRMEKRESIGSAPVVAPVQVPGEEGRSARWPPLRGSRRPRARASGCGTRQTAPGWSCRLGPAPARPRGAPRPGHCPPPRREPCSAASCLPRPASAKGPACASRGGGSGRRALRPGRRGGPCRCADPVAWRPPLRRTRRRRAPSGSSSRSAGGSTWRAPRETGCRSRPWQLQVARGSPRRPDWPWQSRA